MYTRSRRQIILKQLIQELSDKYKMDFMNCTFEEMELQLDLNDWELVHYTIKYGHRPTIH